MKKSELNWYLSNSRYIALENLPDEYQPENFRIIRVQAEKGMEWAKIERFLVNSLGETPKRGCEVRARQLRGLMDKYAQNGKKIAVAIADAHLLPDRTFEVIKSLNEMEGELYGQINIIFLGDMNNMEKKLDKHESIKLRTDMIKDLD